MTRRTAIAPPNGAAVLTRRMALLAATAILGGTGCAAPPGGTAGGVVDPALLAPILPADDAVIRMARRAELGANRGMVQPLPLPGGASQRAVPGVMAATERALYFCVWDAVADRYAIRRRWAYADLDSASLNHRTGNNWIVLHSRTGGVDAFWLLRGEHARDLPATEAMHRLVSRQVGAVAPEADPPSD